METKKPMEEKEYIQKYCLTNITVFQLAGEIVVHLCNIRISNLAISYLIVCKRIATFAIQEKAHTN